MRYVLVLIALLVIASSVSAQTYIFQRQYGSVDIDSITFNLIQTDGLTALDTIYNDSLITSLPTTLEFTLTVDSIYYLQIYQYFSGETDYVNEDVLIPGIYRGVTAFRRSYAVGLYAIDSSGTDEAIQGAKITLTSLGGVFVDGNITASNGEYTFSLDSGSYIVSVVKSPGYTFPLDTVLVTADNDSVPLFGYNIGTDTVSLPNFASVYGYLYSVKGEKLEGAIVTAKRTTKLNSTDTTSGIIFSKEDIWTPTDSNGYFSLTLMRTTAFDDTTKGFYDITATYNDMDIFSIKGVYVPAAGNLNLIDSLANR